MILQVAGKNVLNPDEVKADFASARRAKSLSPSLAFALRNAWSTFVARPPGNFYRLGARREDLFSGFSENLAGTRRGVEVATHFRIISQ